MSNPYNKQHATAAQRVSHLQSRGLLVPRPTIAARKIEEVGYERLRIYFLSRRDHTLANRPFRAGTTYKDILRLYECDAKIRDVCFTGVGRFELVLRNRMSEVLSAQFGSHPYFEITAFENSETHNAALHKLIQTFNQSRDERKKHYQKTYTEPPLPPIWVMKEFLTFGTSARLYRALSSNVRGRIANAFGVSSLPVFDSWVAAFVDLRNICAHHDRLFNRRFQKQLQRYRQAAVPTGDPAKLKAMLECLDLVLSRAGATDGLVNRVQKILDRYPEVSNAEAGF